MPESLRLSRIAPEAVGVESSALVSAIDEVAHTYDLHSIMVYRDGGVIAEKWWWPADPARAHMLHSATKSFVGTAVGFAIAEGVLALDDHVADVLSADMPARPAPSLERLRIVDLLTMRGGNAGGISGALTRTQGAGLVRAFLAEPMTHEPGTVFTYSSASSHLLSAAVQARTGERVADYLQPRLFDPLGVPGPTWDTDPDGISTGGNGMRLRTEELLAYGVLHLDDGVWHGTQILPAGWTEEATRRHVPGARAGAWDGRRLVSRPAAPGRGGYGYHFWVEPGGVYSARGVFGQLCVVHPEARSVVAVTAGVDSRQPGLYAALERFVLPLLEQAAGDARVAASSSDRLLDWSLSSSRPPEPGADDMSAFVGSYEVESNEHDVRRIEIDQDAVRTVVVFDVGNATHRFDLPRRTWTLMRTSLYGADLHHSYPFTDEPVQALIRQEGADRAVLDLRFPEATFRDLIMFRLDDGALVVSRTTNANSGPLEHSPLIAHAVER